ncbi:hypothetical protein AC578_8436 [Pseudocercospora eumusae]|uniref:Uncharacterized protein n=1 Tax=Pseudocercospora eumusae TaxID=321146 RepID=A0A139HS49_9PEZI|nr:hypothetical protein AC578_8436 [Pseudocercospora eumusae]
MAISTQLIATTTSPPVALVQSFAARGQGLVRAPAIQCVGVTPSGSGRNGNTAPRRNLTQDFQRVRDAADSGADSDYEQYSSDEAERDSKLVGSSCDSQV